MKEKAAGKEAWKFASKQTDERMRHLAAEIERVVKSGDAGAVHDLRVAIRRLEQALHMFEFCFSGKTAHKIRRKLKRFMAFAGEVRNSDIAFIFLEKSKHNRGAGATARLRSRRQEDLLELVAVLRNFQEKKSSDKWRAELEAAAAESAHTSRESINKVAPRLLTPMAKDFFKLGKRAAEAKASPKELHRFRIAAKKFRYSLELFIPLYGPSLNPLLAKIIHTQGLLGDINDCETVQEMISRSRGAGDVRKWLRKRQRKTTAEFQKYWSAHFNDETEEKNWRACCSRPAANACFHAVLQRMT